VRHRDCILLKRLPAAAVVPAAAREGDAVGVQWVFAQAPGVTL